ncbi:hypothetical protein IT568_02910 [bacterium]|nr:hypothetical protein [bacterium]
MFNLTTFLILLLLTSLSAQSVSVSLNHPVYEFLKKMEAKNQTSSSAFRVKPFNQNFILTSLKKINTENLTNSEKQLLQIYKNEFDETQNLKQKKFQNPFENQTVDPHLFVFQHKTENSYLIGDLAFEQNLEFWLNDSSAKISETKLLGKIRGKITDKLAFYSEASNALVKGTDQAGRDDFSSGISVSANQGQVFESESNAHVVFDLFSLRFEAGKNSLVYGNGNHSQLTVSNNAGNFDLLRIDKNWGKINFNYFHAFLHGNNRDSTTTSANGETPKWFVGHKIDFEVCNGIYLGLAETVVYSDRKDNRQLEPQYLIPVNFFQIAEKYAGDKDNNTMAFDLTITRFENKRFYGELFLDDFTFTKNPFKHYGSKWAVILGTDFYFGDFVWNLEYSRIEPYLYTSNETENTYRHFSSGLGSFLPQNSDYTFTEISYSPSWKWDFRTSFEFRRHGEGNLDFPKNPESGTKKKFLDKAVEKALIFRSEIRFQPFYKQVLVFGYSLQEFKNLQFAKNKNATFQTFELKAQVEF